MSDLFHELVPDDFVASVFETMAATERHTYQVLTKRPERMRDVLQRLQPLPLANVWLGTSIENNRWVARADALRETPAAVRFISAEPLLGAVDTLDLTHIDWVIVGGESGPRARRMDVEWAFDLVDACDRAGVACFVKQLGSVVARELGLSAKGGGEDLSVFPAGLRVRQMPVAA
jgi:protein gp37